MTAMRLSGNRDGVTFPVRVGEPSGKAVGGEAAGFASGRAEAQATLRSH